MTPYLFVYGTLMSSATAALGQAQRARLLREGRSLGPATAAGRLYDFGRYPGLAESSGAGDIVHGEVYVLNDAAKSLPWLDAYEDIAPDRPGQYVRVERSVRLATGETLTAWMYLLQRGAAHARRVPSGRWTK